MTRNARPSGRPSGRPRRSVTRNARPSGRPKLQRGGQRLRQERRTRRGSETKPKRPTPGGCRSDFRRAPSSWASK
ncbi:hypothetical protein DLJ46_22670 [Micromonospora globispora]|uniref:Uncharacterized protein n=1 Tax=Micromonospora globispora TaxID=1450148 RepID=A0A317JYJ7_9ACTN|nr:hypothetical protein DLJ46_22670 [Micromonospora globispora]